MLFEEFTQTVPVRSCTKDIFEDIARGCRTSTTCHELSKSEDRCSVFGFLSKNAAKAFDDTIDISDLQPPFAAARALGSKGWGYGGEAPFWHPGSPDQGIGSNLIFPCQGEKHICFVRTINRPVLHYQPLSHVVTTSNSLASMLNCIDLGVTHTALKPHVVAVDDGHRHVIAVTALRADKQHGLRDSEMPEHALQTGTPAAVEESTTQRSLNHTREQSIEPGFDVIFC